MTTNQQLELGFQGTPRHIFRRQHDSRVARGKWWFAKMREAVASAMDWQSPSEARPEQIVFSGIKRELKV